MDYLSLKAAVSEASGKLAGTRISDAWQFAKDAIFLLPRRGPGVILSIGSARPGLFLHTGKNLPERFTSSFTDLLRARVKGTVLESISLPERGERIVQLVLSAAWPAKKGEPLKIVLEVMGRHSNLVILDKDLILQPLRAVPAQKSRTRPVIAGGKYIPPPPLAGVAVEDVTVKDLDYQGSIPDPDGLRQLVRGLSPYAASQVLLRALKKGPEGDPDAVIDKENFVQELRIMSASCTGDLGYLHFSGTKNHLCPFEPVSSHADDRIEIFSPFSAASAAWLKTTRKEHEHSEEDPVDLVKDLLEQKKRVESAIEHLETEETRCRDHEKVRVMAEALLIDPGKVPPGSDSVSLPDPHDPIRTLDIALDRFKTAQENANQLFSRARRMRKGLVEIRRKRTQQESIKEEIRKALSALSDLGDPEPARKILGSAAATTGNGEKRQKTSRSGPGRRHLVEGFTILVGKSSSDNEKVTFSAAGPNDLWLHARDYPGSHVVIITEKKKVPDKVLYAAAALAAQSSGARNDTAPEIMVTERKWVRKLKGGRPGQVTVERFRSIRPRKSSI